MNISFSSLWRSAVAGLGACLLVGASQAAGLLTPADGSLPALSIRDQHVDVVIEDGYAVTSVEQVFHNPHDRDLEAHYSFPVPAKGAVSAFTVWIDGRPMDGEVLEKQQARSIYEQEKAAGRSAGLTEQDDYRTFDIFVSPVRAQADTRIKLTYMQPAHLDTGVGRYVYPLEEGGVDEAKLAFWTPSEAVTGSFSFDLWLRSAYPVEALRMPGQAGALITRESAGEWRIRLASSVAGQAGLEGEAGQLPVAPAGGGVAGGSPAFQLDQDLVVYWRLKPGLPGSVDLVTYKPTAEGRGTFMLVVTPGEDLAPITEGRDWVFVLDISGSMDGKYATLVDGMQRALKKLRADDRFRIVLFNNGSRELTSGFVNASADRVEHYSRQIANIDPNGGTNLYGGLRQGLDSLDADRTSGIVLVTDGVANVGETEQKKFIELIRRKDVRLFTMVMGNSANRPMLNAMTRASGGFAISVSNSDDIVGQLLTATGKLTHQALHGVSLEIDGSGSGLKTADISPQTIGSLYRGQQLVAFGHYWGEGEARVTLQGRVSGEHKQYSTRFAFPGTSTGNPEVERLWAFARIEDMGQEIADFGEKPDLRQAIVDLAVEFGLVTDYTSMLVVSDETFAKHGIDRRNQARVRTELAAQQQRAQQAVQSRRADTRQPMYTAPRASLGGGSWDALALLMLLPLLWLAPGSAGRRV